jgi:hypothetical protein
VQTGKDKIREICSFSKVANVKKTSGIITQYLGKALSHL